MAFLEHNFTADGDSAEQKAYGGRANQYMLKMGANTTLGGGTITAQYKESATGAYTIVATVDDTIELDQFEVPSGYLKINLAGATAPDVDGIIQPH